MNVQETITSRRSVRSYTAEQLTETELRTVLDAAYSSPVAGTLYKTMRLTVVQNPSVLSRINAAIQRGNGNNTNFLYAAPTLIIVSGQADFDGHALFANAGCIMQNVQLSAWDMMLGSVIIWAIGTVLPKEPGLLSDLGIADGFVPLAGVVIGHPAKQPAERDLKAVFETNYIV